MFHRILTLDVLRGSLILYLLVLGRTSWDFRKFESLVQDVTMEEISAMCPTPALSFYHITTVHFLLSFVCFENTVLPPPDYKQSEGMLHAL